jgi:uncharacterized protein
MRRKEQEIVDRKEIDSIINRSEICRIALSVNDLPYIVPVNFGYKNNCLYFHSAKEGQKIDMIKFNNRVCFQMDADYSLITNNTACTWSMKYKSVIGFGRAVIVEDIAQKKKALDIIMAHYAEGTFEYADSEVDRLAIIKIEIESVTGKQSGY